MAFLSAKRKCQRHFALTLVRRKLFQEKRLSLFCYLSRPNATRNLWPPKILAFLEKRSKQVIVSQCLRQQTKDKSAVCDAIRTIMVSIIFVCTFIFSFFVLLFSSHRIIFGIKNKKEKIKVAVEFFKAPNENANGILRLLSCEESRCQKMSRFLFCSRTIFVCVLLFYFFVFHFSFCRIIKYISNFAFGLILFGLFVRI